MAEFCCNNASEKPSGASGTQSPCFYVFRVAPHQVTKWTFVRNFNPTVNEPSLVKAIYIWAQSPVNAEYTSIDYCPNAKVVKYISAITPRTGIAVLPYRFIIKPVDCRYLASLMVATQQGEMARVF